MTKFQVGGKAAEVGPFSGDLKITFDNATPEIDGVKENLQMGRARDPSSKEGL